MQNRIFQLTLSILIFLSFSVSSQPNIDLETFATGFTRPVDIQNTGEDSRLFIVEQAGKIWILDSLGNKSSSPFLDISARVKDDNNEQGLLGIAFHPDFQNNPSVFVHYTTPGDSTKISLFPVTSNPDSADPNTEFVIFKEPQPFTNHNGGSIAFGPDGYLYIALGDGGSGGDPGNRAQDLSTVLGKILRININTAMPYGVPSDNPFVGAGGGVREEIWAYGLRNPWKISFDRLTGDMWIGDVGQDALEEIDFQSASSNGGENYGWRCKEGTNVFNSSGCPPDSTLIDPVFEFSHSSGGCSVTGGVVYRGTEFPGLNGLYFFSDICTGWISSLDSNFNYTNHGAFSSSDFFVTFGENMQGEVFVAGLNDGIISRIVEVPQSIKGIENSGIDVFPNPAHQILNIQITNDKSFYLEVLDLQGKMIKSDHIKTRAKVLEIDDLQSGVYLLKFQNPQGTFFHKIVIAN